MPNTNINDILKKGDKTKVKLVDYSTPKKRKELKKLKNECEVVLSNKYVSDYKLSQIIIKI